MDALITLIEPVLGIVEIPLTKLGYSLTVPWQRLVYLVVVLILLYKILDWVIFLIRRRKSGDALSDEAEIDALLKSRGDFNASTTALATLKTSQEHLIKTKQWAELARLFDEANSPKDAAKYFMKAKMHKEAAQQFAHLGKTEKAAKMMVKAGDYQTAGLFYVQQAKFAPAAKVFEEGDLPALAGDAYGKAGNFTKSVECYIEYFSVERDNAEIRYKAAQECAAIVFGKADLSKVEPAQQSTLFAKLGEIYKHNHEYLKSAELYHRAGDLVHAAEVYVLAGKLQEAATCYKSAGQEREANKIGGRFYAQNQRWKEAAMAYAGAGEYLNAAECFAKDNDPIRAGEYFEKANAFSKAGHAYVLAKKFDKGIEVLQKVPDSDENFDISRGLLGRCFYEIHDYEHCAATLDNHLLGKRVEKENIDYFYMLSLAWEQLGNLAKSKDILLKIGSVNAKFRDLDQRLSSIDSRISMMNTQTDYAPQSTPSGGTGGPEMTMVANTLKERYDLEVELGRGGMGVVYRAQDKQLDRKVALKFLGSLVDSSDEFRKRFIREAQTAAKINHPNIVAIYDISASEGKSYIAMEYIEGDNLFKHIRDKKKLDAREAINIMVQSCGALGALHDAGIVHRDIKPDNIVLAKGGLVKLMDFGLAKSDDNRLTKANMVMGTPSYMSPEQAKGKEVDGRSDLYSMGLVLYEMLTGDVVFKDGDIMMRQIQEMPKKLNELNPEISEALSEVAYKCIAKDPDARYANANEMINAFRSLQTS